MTASSRRALPARPASASRDSGGDRAGRRRWLLPSGEEGEEGRVTAFVVIAVAGLLLVAGLVLDGGNALAARTRAIGIAEEAARAGCQQLDLAAYRAGAPLRLDPGAADRAARTYLAAAGATGTVTVTVDSVEVSATLRSQPQLLDVIGVGTFEVTGTGAARPAAPT